MKLKYANSTAYLRESAIRAVTKLIDRPGMISFAGGSPSPESFLVKELQKADQEILEKHADRALAYSGTEGLGELMDIIISHMAAAGMPGVKRENLIITNGSQQGLDFCARILLDPGDIVICEDPGYVGGINAIAAYGPRFVGVEMDSEGMRPDALEQALRSHPEAKFIYLVPSFQNPTGRTMGQVRRQEVLQVAKRYGVPIVEDDPYSELYYDGEKQLPIKHYDTDFDVIYLGTYSKTFCPGLRVGWICAAPEVIRKFSLVKQSSDLHTSTLAQMQLAAVIDSIDWNAHLNDIRAIYKRKRDLMMDCIEKYLPKSLTYTYPAGGFFTWIELPEGVTEEEVLEAGLEKLVAFVPGAAFYANGGPHNHIRLSFSTSSDQDIEIGIQRLGEVLRELCP